MARPVIDLPCGNAWKLPIKRMACYCNERLKKIDRGWAWKASALQILINQKRPQPRNRAISAKRTGFVSTSKMLSERLNREISSTSEWSKKWQKRAGGMASNLRSREASMDSPATKRVGVKDILALLHKQLFRCAYTGEELTPENVGADHMTPVSRGGSNEIENIALVLGNVNSAKGTMTVEEFVEMCRKVTIHFGLTVEGESRQTPTLPTDFPKDADPSEILMRLGYIDAAAEVNQTKIKLEAANKRAKVRGGREVPAEEYTEQRREEIAKLNQEIYRLRVVRSHERAKTGHTA